MIEKTPISDTVRAVCDEHFRGGAGCGYCPIRAACHSGPTGNLTFERIEEWRVRLNAAALAERLPSNSKITGCTQSGASDVRPPEK